MRVCHKQNQSSDLIVQVGQMAATDSKKAVEIAKQIPGPKVKWQLIASVLSSAAEAASQKTDKNESMKTYEWVRSEADQIPFPRLKASVFKAMLPNLPKDSPLAKEAEKKAVAPAPVEGHRRHNGHHHHWKHHIKSKL